MLRGVGLIRSKSRGHQLLHLHRWFARWSTQFGKAFILLVVLGWIVTLRRICWQLRPLETNDISARANSELSFSFLDSRIHLLQEDRLNHNLSTSSSPTFGFVFATGRSGTKHLSLAMKSSSGETGNTNSLLQTGSFGVYVTHQEEDDRIRTRDVVCTSYRRLVRGNPRHSGTEQERIYQQKMAEYVSKVKLPFYRRLLTLHQHATHLVYTGHIPTAFGLFPALLDALPPGSVRLLRLRRDRVANALSLMALGPEAEDPWSGGTSGNSNDADLKVGSLCSRRWFPTPWDVHIRLHPGQWDRMNRFQRWLWYVDDVECRWQALKRSHGSTFSFLEESLDSIHILDGGDAWRRIGNFLGAPVDQNAAVQRHNSIQAKHRSKLNVTEATLRAWDEDYRRLVGPCRLDSNVFIRWPTVTSST